ncbi:HAMP domain-containing protein [Exiguobacterium sp. SL14]|nr:HAMP domain-containing protein [Exiguobacterium sp. SL14]MCY1691825.1 HAMP domain-containing protein [Exiguobacterium sp. SL14]
MNRESGRLAKGEDATPIVITNRQDEIGELTSTFNEMATAISGQKYQLVSSNDELQSQQEELIAQARRTSIATGRTRGSARHHVTQRDAFTLSK